VSSAGYLFGSALMDHSAIVAWKYAIATNVNRSNLSQRPLPIVEWMESECGIWPNGQWKENIVRRKTDVAAGKPFPVAGASWVASILSETADPARHRRARWARSDGRTPARSWGAAGPW